MQQSSQITQSQLAILAAQIKKVSKLMHNSLSMSTSSSSAQEMAPPDVVGGIAIWIEENYRALVNHITVPADHGLIKIGYSIEDVFISRREQIVEVKCFATHLQIQSWAADYQNPEFFDKLKIALDKLFEGGSLWVFEDDDLCTFEEIKCYDPQDARFVTMPSAQVQMPVPGEPVRIRGPPSALPPLGGLLEQIFRRYPKLI